MESVNRKRLINQFAIISIIAIIFAVTLLFFSLKNVNGAFKRSIFGYLSRGEELHPDADFIEFLDVGQGDSILIYSNGQSALIDTGTEKSGIDICRELGKLSIKEIDVVLETHLHMDHVGGIERIVNRFNIRNLILPDLNTNSEGFPAAKAAKETVLKSDGAVYTAVSGMNFNIGEFEITVIAYYPEKEEENDRSIICMAKKGDIRFLLTADAERAAEFQMIEDNIDFGCDVLKVAHHGSKTSTCKEFLYAAKPKYAVISVGSSNDFSHPNKGVLKTLKGFACKVYRTDKQGNIVFDITSGEMKITTEF
ncbi:MAG: MBL fold metallo-hydrolase [Clostridia bacterium]|nr:MBL fold metallo-hydrolase [Clostridia bacterium]